MKVYSYRLDHVLNQQFQQLAIQTFRSRSGLIRYLISLAIQNPQLVLPNVGILLDDSNIPAISSDKFEDQKG